MSIPPIKPITPILGTRLPAQPKRPIGRTCLTCQGRGWIEKPPGLGQHRPTKAECKVCHGKGRVVV